MQRQDAVPIPQRKSVLHFGGALQSSSIEIRRAMSKPATPTKLSRRQLYRMVWAKPLSGVAEDLGMSTNGLAKICDRVGVPYPARGYWARKRAGRIMPKASLPADPEHDKAPIFFSASRSPSRRTRSRLSAEERREQVIAAARTLLLRDGLHQTTMKRIAREIGMSEAMAHNYFSRDALLTELARRELREMEFARQSDIEQGKDTHARAILGTVRYLREVDRRGALIQVLLTDPTVRAALREERHHNSRAGLERRSTAVERELGVPPAISKDVTRILTAVSLRAGRLLATHKIDLATAERLLIPIIIAGNSRVAEKWGRNRKPTGAAASSGPRGRR